MAAFTEAPISSTAAWVGTTEVVMRLLLSLVLGYVFAFIYRIFIQSRSAFIQHLYFSICGTSIIFFNYGWNIIHSFISVLINYVLIVTFGGSNFSVVAAYLINTTYLVVGYFYEGKNEYDLSWTIPQCVLTLRLIGVVIDVYDGKKPQDQLSSEQKQSALYRNPTLLEMFGHSYFYAGVLVGPQFDMKRYLTLVHGGFIDKQTGQQRNSVTPGVVRFLLGVFYLLQYHAVDSILPDEYFLTEKFQNHNFFIKNALILIWGKFVINKYIGVWLITEGACIVTGLAYNGKDENGNDLWDGCRNIHLKKLETVSYFQDVIAAFNFNTNKWMAKYLFKRLKFLGNKYISQAITLFYLALWHGIHFGYYMNFFLEFVMVNFETQMKIFLGKSSVFSKIYNSPDITYVSWFIRKAIIQHAVSYALISFVLLHSSRWGLVYSSVGYCLHIFYCIGLPIVYLLNMSMKSSKSLASEKRHIFERQYQARMLVSIGVLTSLLLSFVRHHQRMMHTKIFQKKKDQDFQRAALLEQTVKKTD